METVYMETVYMDQSQQVHWPYGQAHLSKAHLGLDPWARALCYGPKHNLRSMIMDHRSLFDLLGQLKHIYIYICIY